MTQPTTTQAGGQPTTANPVTIPAFNVHSVASILETLGFVAAAVLYGLGLIDAGTETAICSAIMHGINH